MITRLLPMMALMAGAATPSVAQEAAVPCALELVVLGAGQDAGAPQIGNAADDGLRLWPSSLAVVDRARGERYLFDATPAITDQLALLDEIAPPAGGIGLNGIFLTHAHIGHYLGLAWLGREAAGTNGVPVYAMPRMAEFLRGNGPWSQLVEFGNIELRDLADGDIQPITDNFGVWAIAVPHRDEYSETVGFVVMSPGKTALYIPDIDSWEEFAAGGRFDLPSLIAAVDHAFIDATFWDDGELEGRDMSEIPHPRVVATMDMLADLPEAERAKINFIHYNHTNPLRDPASAESADVVARGFDVARRGDRACLD
jgi:pyrroloquinoline quinone biosynthesis protein B